MPVAGRKPNEGKPVRHRVKPVHEWTEVEDDSFDGAPELPKPAQGRAPWPPETKAWWKAVSRMPHCVLWDDSDWQFAFDTARVAAAFHVGDTKAATELRQREKVMGTTLDARRDLRIRYVPAGTVDAASAGVMAIDDYRTRLRGRKSQRTKERIG